MESAFGAGQKTVAADAIVDRAAVQTPSLNQGKGETAEETVAPVLIINQAAFHQRLTGIPEPGEKATQTSAWSVADAHPFDYVRAVDSAFGQIGASAVVLHQLPLMEAVSLLEQFFHYRQAGSGFGRPFQPVN